MIDSKVLDLSEYQWAPRNTSIDFRRCREHGIERVWIGSNYANISASMCSAAVTAGMELFATYAFIYFGLRYDTVETAIRNALQYGAERVVLDVEAENHPGRRPQESADMTPERRIAILRQAVADVRAAGLRPWIYSAGWYWRPKMNNTTEFSDLPLVIAAYGRGSAPRPPIYTADFGGWRTVHMHQYTSIVPPYPGYSGVDHSYLLRNDDTEDDEMATTKELEARVEELERRTGGAIAGEIGVDLYAQILGLNTAVHKLADAMRNDSDGSLAYVIERLDQVGEILASIDEGMESGDAEISDTADDGGDDAVADQDGAGDDAGAADDDTADAT